MLTEALCLIVDMMNTTNNRIEVPYKLNKDFDVKQAVNEIQQKLIHL